MSFDKTIFYSHIEHASKLTSPIDKFLSLWRAFNYYYEIIFYNPQEEQKSEALVFKKAISKISKQNRKCILEAAAQNHLDSISPIINMRAMRDVNPNPTKAHKQLVQAIENYLNQREITLEDVNSVVKLLYVVRCNASHGFKTPDGPRDSAIFKATIPVLEALLSSLDMNYR